MSQQSTIALQVPNSNDPDRYFTFRLKQQLNDEPGEYDSVDRLMILSDIEGNFRALQKLLINNGVIDRKHQWTFGEGHLVILGDCFDRGESVAECLWLIYSLEERAKRKGGYVHFILGNHEIMNLQGDWRYVHPKYAQKLLSFPGTALYDGNNELARWLCTKNIIEKIGNLLLVHGGISPLINQLPLTIYEMNQLAKSVYNIPDQQTADPLCKIIFNSFHAPFWYRGYYQPGEADEALIDSTLKNFNVTNIITGHTTVSEVSAFFHGKVINVDTDHASGTSEALMIENNTFYRVDNMGSREELLML